MMNSLELDILTVQLRALRLPDKDAVMIEVGSVADPECGMAGAIRVTATKGRHTCTSSALRLEDAMLMVCARIKEAEERERKAKAEKKGDADD